MLEIPQFLKLILYFTSIFFFPLKTSQYPVLFFEHRWSDSNFTPSPYSPLNSRLMEFPLSWIFAGIILHIHNKRRESITQSFSFLYSPSLVQASHCTYVPAILNSKLPHLPYPPPRVRLLIQHACVTLCKG